MFCPRCNTQNPETTKFCIKCGSPLLTPPSPEPTVQPPSSIPKTPPEQPSKSKKPLMIIGAVLILLLVVGGLGAFVVLPKLKPQKQLLPGLQPSPGLEKPSQKADQECETLYQQLLAQYAEDYEVCFKEVGVATCEKPSGFTDEFKENLNVLVILDSSGSMAQTVPGGQKMQIAKKVISDFVNSLPERAKVGLMVYGHKGSNSEKDKAVSCAGIEMVYPLSELNKTTFDAAVASFNPTGWTPIADSFQKAQEVLGSYESETNSNLIYLVSDGIETCDGNPVAAARQLRQSNIRAIVNIVGFDVNDEAQRQLKEAAEAGGGTYYQASSSQEMEEVFGNYYELLKQYNESYFCVQENAIQVMVKKTGIWTCLQEKNNGEYFDILGYLNDAYFVRHEISQNCRSSIQSKIEEKFRKNNDLIKALKEENLDEFRRTSEDARKIWKENLEKARKSL